MQQSKGLRDGLKKAWIRYDRFMEKQGFYLVLAVCILVILLSALYTFRYREKWREDEVAHHAESMMTGGTQDAQSLAEAQKLVQGQSTQSVLIPQETKLRFSQPVEGFLDRDFSITEPQLFEAAHYWRVHIGIDLQAEYGTPVTACADGHVTVVEKDNEKGLCIRISHDLGYQSVYAGLSDASYVRHGDPVRRGQTIGHVGNGVLAEADAAPHLHFEVWKGQSPIDPVELFLGVNE